MAVVPVIDAAPLQHGLEQVGQGLAVVGPDLTLRLWNRSYEDLLGLPDGLCRPQARYADILKHRAAAVLAEDVEPYIKAELALVAQRTTRRTSLKHASGRMVEIERLFLADGSFLEFARETEAPTLEHGRPSDAPTERDDITGLPNRNYFLTLLEKSLANGATDPGTMLFVGLEDFQDVNHFLQPDMDEQAKRLGLIKLELRHALERDELVVFYQPKIDLRTGLIIGMEALLRWRHPEHGMIPPGQFIPVAERTGLIAPISDWMMREACRQTRLWKDTGVADLRLAVNLSTVQFRRQSVIGSITAILEDTGFDPEMLEIEVTESVLLGDDDMVTETFSWLKAIGIPIAIDDFGTGYSSLSYLMRFAADTVKIDASFIKNLHENQDGATITRAIISLAHSLKMKVVAEGVELPQHLMFLVDENCDIGQGYLFGRPVAAADFEALVKTQPNFIEDAAKKESERRSGPNDRRGP